MAVEENNNNTTADGSSSHHASLDGAAAAGKILSFNHLRQYFSSLFRAPKRWASATVFLFFVLLAFGAFFLFWVDESVMDLPFLRRPRNPDGLPLACYNGGTNQTCIFESDKMSNESCPEYFRWMYEDLKTWKTTGITRDTLERAKPFAHFRLVILNGTAYLEQYHGAYQTRDVFTIWSLAMLVSVYPGKLPDLELMFRLEDRAAIQKRDFHDKNGPPPPVLFQYCGDSESVGVIFPDWSFWGWVEVNIKPWSNILEAIIEGGNKTKWKDRVPYAYWKGNQDVGNRRDLMKCNGSRHHDWNARLYTQDWGREIQEGFKHSNLEDQCTHRYKIYMEGWGWSVSQKYILACDAVTLLVKPNFYDFFSRGLVPLKHYWPISTKNKCKDIKFAVDWGNNHPDKAQAIGEEGTKFVQELVKMEYVYDYMFHLLSEYAKLLKFKPEVPKDAVKLSVESLASKQNGKVKEYMLESMVKSPKETSPCKMVPPYDDETLEAILQRKKQIERQVQKWEEEYASPKKKP